MDSIKKKVKDKGLSDYVVFVGKTDHTEIEYQIADVFVLPSLYESFGLVNVEAQCAGLPCVISDTVPKEIRITERVQFLSLQSSPEIWADAILANDHLSRNSHHEEVISNHYSIKKEALKLSDLYRSILKKTSDKE